LDPTGHGITNTINRAELAPIEYALREGMGTHIASDSACSLYQIAKMIHKPMYMQQHKHAPLLQTIVDHIRAAPSAIYLYKVPAHAGLIGNERADQLAKEAAAEDCKAREMCTVSADTPMHSMYWPTSLATEDSPDAEAPAVPGPHGQRWHLSDLGKSLKGHMHALHRLGHSNLESLYYQAWRRILPQTDGQSSNAFMRLPQGITPRERRLTIQARTGTLLTGKILHRMGKRRTDQCKRCGLQPDGVHHSLSGCPAMTGMYTLRHNELGGECYKAVGKGSLGASVVAQDIGRHNAAETPEEQAEIRTRIGSTLRAPRKLTDDERRQFDRYRPDIFIQHDTIHFHIVEFKCCRDTDPDRQRGLAIKQHQELVMALHDLFGGQPIMVQVHPILIGVTGTIYKEFYDTMDLLGVSKAAAKRCAAKLHKIAVSYVDKIMTTKWQQERHGVG
jgi:ribonuclease HI